MNLPTFFSEFIDTFSLWLGADEPIPKHLLWGHPLFVWARWGKVLEILGASVSLYEIWATTAAKYAEGVAPVAMLQTWKETWNEVSIWFESQPRKYFKGLASSLCLPLLIFALVWWHTKPSGLGMVLFLLMASILGTLGFSLVGVLTIFLGGFVARLVAAIGAEKSAVVFIGFTVICLGLILDLLGT